MVDREPGNHTNESLGLVGGGGPRGVESQENQPTSQYDSLVVVANVVAGAE